MHTYHSLNDTEKREHPIKTATFLMKEGYPPIVLRKEERGKYYHFLRIADEGDLGPFANFIAKSVDESLRLYLAIGRKWHSTRRALLDYIREHAKINLCK